MVFKKNIFKLKLYFIICLHLNFINNLFSSEYSGYDISQLEADAISSASQNNFGSSQDKSEVETQVLELPEGTDTTVTDSSEGGISPAGVAAIGVGAAVVLGAFLKWLWNKRKKKKIDTEPSGKDVSEFEKQKKPVIDELEKALSFGSTTDEFKKHVQYLKESVSSLNETEDDESFKKLLVASENFSEVHLSKDNLAGLSPDELAKLKSANSQISKLRRQEISADERSAILDVVKEKISNTEVPEKTSNGNSEKLVDTASDETKPLFDPEVKKTQRQRLNDSISEKKQAILEKAKAIKDKILPKQKPISRPENKFHAI